MVSEIIAGDAYIEHIYADQQDYKKQDQRGQGVFLWEMQQPCKEPRDQKEEITQHRYDEP